MRITAIVTLLALPVLALGSSLSDLASRAQESSVGVFVDVGVTPVGANASPALRTVPNGSGVVVAPHLVVTAAHVVAGAAMGHIWVGLDARWSEGEPEILPARVVASDAVLDLALLDVEGLKAPAVEIASPSALRLGDDLFLLGRPLGGPPLLGKGIVSSLRLTQPAKAQQVKLIGIDGPVVSGSSGGGVFRLKDGRLVGIVTQKAGRLSDELEALTRATGGAEIVAGGVGIIGTQKQALTEMRHLFSAGYGWAVDAEHVRALLGRKRDGN